MEADAPHVIDVRLPPVTKYQQAAIFCSERNAVIEATTKAGKTLGCLFWLIYEAGHGKPGAEYWWVAPIYEQTRIAYRRLCRMLTDADPTGSAFKKNDTDPSVTLANQTVIRFKSADKPDGLYGEDVHAAVVDEASRAKEDAYFAIRSTLTATQGKLRVIGNVKGRKNWAYRLARKVEAGSLPDWRYAKITALDAIREGVIEDSEVEAARRELPEHVFKELYLAEPSEDGSNPFGLDHIAACVCDLSPGEPAVFGIDLAKSVDWTVVVGLTKTGLPCVFERWQHEPWNRTTERILSIIGHTPTLIDSTGVGDPIVEAIARVAPAAEGLKFTATSKQQLMEGLSVAIQGRKTGILDGVMRAEFEAFEYEHTRTGVRYSAPEGFHDDCVCAHGLAVRKLSTMPTVTAAWSGGLSGPKHVDLNTRKVLDFAARREKDAEWGWR